VTRPEYIWVAFAGLCLQLVGIIWDTLLHHSDPGLAARENVVSLTNPSHLLIAAGITLTTIGVGLVLFHLARGRSSTRAAIAVVALITLWLGTMTVALRTGGVSGRHDHADPSSER
jgi:low temperature requirement protein LtrA